MKQNFWRRVIRLGLRNIKLFAKAELKVIGISLLLYALGIHLIGYDHALFIAGVIAVVDILPVLGSGLVFIPWIFYEWIAGIANHGWWLLAVYLGVNLIKQIIEPWFLGKDLELPFWMPLVITIGATIIFNVWGIAVAGLLIPFISAYRQVRRETY